MSKRKRNKRRRLMNHQKNNEPAIVLPEVEKFDKRLYSAESATALVMEILLAQAECFVDDEKRNPLFHKLVQEIAVLHEKAVAGEFRQHHVWDLNKLVERGRVVEEKAEDPGNYNHGTPGYQGHQNAHYSRYARLHGETIEEYHERWEREGLGMGMYD